MNALFIDDPSSWPPEVRTLLDDRLLKLRAYEGERRRIETLCARDVHVRMNPPPNPFEQVFNGTIEEVRRAIASLNVRGWHCTRLTEDEVKDLADNGLSPLSQDDLLHRIDRRERLGDVSSAQSARLKAKHQAGSSGRAGAIHFGFTQAELLDQSAVGRLLTSWGGEALYNSHENDAETGPLLRRIGAPRLVLVALPIVDVCTFQGIAESVYRYRMHVAGVSTSNNYGCEGTLRRPTKPNEIVRVLTLGENEFERMTQCSRWTRALK